MNAYNSVLHPRNPATGRFEQKTSGEATVDLSSEASFDRYEYQGESDTEGTFAASFGFNTITELGEYTMGDAYEQAHGRTPTPEQLKTLTTEYEHQFFQKLSKQGIHYEMANDSEGYLYDESGEEGGLSWLDSGRDILSREDERMIVEQVFPVHQSRLAS